MAIERKIDQFIRQCRVSRSVNFPQVCKDLEMDWFGEIKPAIEANERYQKMVQEHLEEIRYHIISKIAETAIEGRPRNGRAPDTGSATAFMKFVDKGAILGKMPEEKEEGKPKGLTPEEEAEHLKRLNIAGASDKDDSND